MKLRSGKAITEMANYKTIKDRCSIVYPLEKVQSIQIRLLINKLSSWNHRILSKDVNELLLTIMQDIPELVANHVKLRNTIQKRTNEILDNLYYKDTISNDILKAINEYFEWLKLRSDYEEEPEIIMNRVKGRTREFNQELIEVLYHPDRYERMVKKFGEVWADEHLPC